MTESVGDVSLPTMNFGVYTLYTNIWREIDNNNINGLAAHPDFLTKINDRAPNGNTPLFLACLRRNTSIIHLLLQMGADANAECRSASPLFACVLKGEIEAVKILLEFGANPNVLCTARKISPLHLAASKGIIEICKLLVEHGADVSISSPKYGSALHIAVSKNHKFIMNYLLSQNIQVNTTNQEGETPFHVAVRSGFLEIVQKLMEQPSLNATAKDGSDGNTVLHTACLYSRETVALLLINKFPDLIYVRNNERQTPLFYGNDSIRRAIKLAFINKKQGFANAWNTKVFSDIKFMVENKPIYAHKVIMKCRCPALYQLCVNQKEVVIKDVENAVFLAFLYYIYTDNLHCDKVLLPQLTKCAERFNLVRLKKLSMEATSKIYIEVPESNWKLDMIKALEVDELSDVTFLIEDKPLHAHRVILLQSAYFRAMLEPGKLKESTQKEIVMKDIEYDVFEVLIFYAYTGEMKEVEPEKAVEVLQANDYFQFSEGLRHCCEAYLCTCINKATVCQLFALAEHCGSIFLKEECFDYILAYYKTISETPEWEAMGPELQQEVNDYLKRQQEVRQAKKKLIAAPTNDQNYSLL